jgi:hypothetical protein
MHPEDSRIDQVLTKLLLVEQNLCMITGAPMERCSYLFCTLGYNSRFISNNSTFLNTKFLEDNRKKRENNIITRKKKLYLKLVDISGNIKRKNSHYG